MKAVYAVVAASLCLAACHKESTPLPEKPLPTPPAMLYTDLHNREMKTGQSQLIDLDQDGVYDIAFDTWLIGDPIEQKDEVLFFAASFTHSRLFTNEHNSSPLLNKGEVIPLGNEKGYEWYEVAQVELARKNIPMQGPIYWELDWRNASHRYLALQVVKNNQRYNGWIELSFNSAAEKLILHQAAISKEVEKPVTAGL